MNRLLMLLISFLLTGITQAQYVGIGTTTPAKMLDVNGDALINGLTIGMGSGNISTNTAIGNSALISNTTALGNTAIGYASQSLTTTGIANTSIGFRSMANNSEGYYNVSLGAWTLNQNSNGYHNTAVGYGSLYGNNTGFENTGLGYGAAMGAGNLQNATAIGAKAYAAASNSLILGSVAGENGAVNSVNVGIGTTTPTARLDVEGSVRLADGTQALGFVLTSDNNGVATWKPGANPALEGLLCNLYFSLGLPEPGLCSRITAVTVTSNMGECCGGTLAAILDGSGLTSPTYLGLHNSNDETGWKSNFTLSGFLLFDLQAAYNLQRFAVWNHGQLGGDRGVNGISIETSVDGVTYTALSGGPSQLAKATTIPVAAQKFVLASPVTARYVRFNILSGYGAVNTGLGEVMFWAN